MSKKIELTLHYPTIIAARNELHIVRDEHVDLSPIADFIQGYLDLPGPDDPFVHSACIARIVELMLYAQSQDITRLENQLGIAIVIAFLESETFKFGDVNTPSEILGELFSPELMAEFRQQLLSVPVIPSFDDDGQAIRVPDLFSCKFLARRLGTIAETTAEFEARRNRRLFGQEETFKISYVAEGDLEGEEYVISDFDEWAALQNFPWDGEIEYDDSDGDNC